MDNPWILFIFGMTSVYFGVQTLRLLPALLRLLAALSSGIVKWPGPIAEYPISNARVIRQRVRIHTEHLFSTFIGFTSGVIGAFVFSMMWLLNGFLLVVVPQEGKSWIVAIMVGITFLGGKLSIGRALQNVAQLNALLSDLSSGKEPRQVVGRSAEAEYAIEHPLIVPRTPRTDSDKALHIYRESLTHLQAGDRRKAADLHHQAMSLDPALHKRAHESLSGMVKGSGPIDAGPIYYWLGVHSEYLGDSQQAADWYEKAANAFCDMGHEKRQGRAYSNLGTVLLKLGNQLPAMEAFDKATALNSKDGIAHLNIGMMYYMSSDRGDAKHKQALEAFANAILADPETYDPLVTSRMRSYAYEWEDDLSEVLRRVSNKRR